MADTAKDGDFFTRAYTERGLPTRDSVAFRNRLIGYLDANHRDEFWQIASTAKQELGLIVPTRRGISAMIADVSTFLESASIPNVLNLITIVWRVLEPRYGHNNWREFVARAIRDENLGYTIDARGGMRFLVDEEFERNRISALRATDLPKYAAVRAAFESAHSYLDKQPPDTKASVRSMFEALEILARLMDQTSNNLNKWQVINKLKPIALSVTSDPFEKKSLSGMFDGIAEWVDAMHLYRHGQGTQDPVAPSIGFAVYALSSGAAALRLLLEIDNATNAARGEGGGGQGEVAVGVTRKLQT